MGKKLTTEVRRVAYSPNEVGIDPIVFRISFGSMMPLPNPADIPPAPKVRGYLLPGDEGYVPYNTVPEDERSLPEELELRT